MKNIIIQAGGKGTRLEKYTHNKPKCLVSVNNMPILFYAFKKFPYARFQVICDYKSEVLEKYLAVYGKEYDYTLIKTKKKGTASGVKDALENIPEDEPFMLMWSDLILSEDWQPPTDLTKNYIGISKDFECRWSYVGGKLVKAPSRENGVAGLFIFSNKGYLANVPEENGFVRFLQNREEIINGTVPLYGTKEVGTILSYNECDDRSNKCRPFNRMEFDNNVVTKYGITEQGKLLALDEAAWYQKVVSMEYKNIPVIYQYNPLKMERIHGRNIFEYTDLSSDQKKTILKKIVQALQDLHGMTGPVPAVKKDTITTYLAKTYNRIKDVQDMIPFARDRYICINGKKCRNVFYMFDEVEQAVEKIIPSEFKFIHGDNTFSNIMFDSFHEKVVLIDPRGYFGSSRFYGDEYYDWAKLYYSLIGNYDQFNRKNFTLTINEDNVNLTIGSNHWEDMEEEFYRLTEGLDHRKIKLLHSLIWISLTTYAWDDYDSICGAFYNGVYYLNEVLL